MADDARDSGAARTDFALVVHILLHRLLTLIGLNVLYLLCSLPIVTIPAASTGMMRSMRCLLDGEDASPFRLFFRAALLDFWRAALCGGVTLLLFSSALGAALYYWSMNTPASLPFFGFCVLAAAYLYASAGCMFAMLESVSLPPGALIKNALLLPAVEAPTVIPASLGSMVIWAVCAWTLPRSLPLMVLIVPAAAALVMCCGARTAIYKRILKR